MKKLAPFLAVLALATGASACAKRSNLPTLSIEARGTLLTHYADGEPLEQLARELQLADPDVAREVVHHEMLAITKRYYRVH